MTPATRDPFAATHTPTENASIWWKAQVVGDSMIGRIVRDFTHKKPDGDRRSLELAPAVAIAAQPTGDGGTRYQAAALDAFNVNVSAGMVAKLAHFRIGDLIAIVYAGEKDTGKDSKMHEYTIYRATVEDLRTWLDTAGRSDIPF